MNTKKKPSKLLLIGLGVVGIGAAAGIGYWFYSRNKKSYPTFPVGYNGGKPEPTSDLPTVTDSGFPLKQGSRGALVTQLQEALISRYGMMVLPKYGADGVWGNETSTALQNNGWPIIIDRTTFSDITQNTPAYSWSLTGVDAIGQVETTSTATVWDENGFTLNVPPQTLLGDAVQYKDGVVTFRTMDNNILYVNSNSVIYV